ncbi:MAG: hypothetical protein KBG30_14450, partial [Bacteroidales bacterium]|nr:hypothetical protein [Bacteroidales bacterium]
MANLILLFGETGSGKSRSTKSLNPDETYMIKCVDKDLPYREGRKAFSQQKKNLALTANYREICTILEKIDQTRSDIKTIIIDDIGFVMTK